jgi:hypothetical protein
MTSNITDLTYNLSDNTETDIINDKTAYIRKFGNDNIVLKAHIDFGTLKIKAISKIAGILDKIEIPISADDINTTRSKIEKYINVFA